MDFRKPFAGFTIVRLDAKPSYVSTRTRGIYSFYLRNNVFKLTDLNRPIRKLGDPAQRSAAKYEPGLSGGEAGSLLKESPKKFHIS